MCSSDLTETGQQWPWFVKTSFKTVRELDGLPAKVTKKEPPIRHELLSPDSRTRFSEGQLSTASLSILCPDCGAVLRAAKLTPQTSGALVGRCIACDEPIADLDTTLRYYSGVALLDSSAIISGAVSKDLDKSGFFGGFTLLLHSLVSVETDTPGGKKELERLADFGTMDRIGWKMVGGATFVKPSEHDAVIIDAASEYNAILVTRDKGMYGNAAARGVFCLPFKT